MEEADIKVRLALTELGRRGELKSRGAPDEVFDEGLDRRR